MIEISWRKHCAQPNEEATLRNPRFYRQLPSKSLSARFQLLYALKVFSAIGLEGMSVLLVTVSLLSHVYTVKAIDQTRGIKINYFSCRRCRRRVVILSLMSKLSLVINFLTVDFVLKICFVQFSPVGEKKNATYW